MTGYARCETQCGGVRLSWELRSVNHRYLDLQFKLPEDFRAVESECRQLATARIGRGKVEAGLRVQRDPSAAEPLVLHPARLQELQQAIAELGRQFGSLAAPDPVRLLAFPGVLHQPPADTSGLQREALALFGRALAAFNDGRSGEGARTEAALRERAASLQALVIQVRERHRQLRGGWLDRQRQRLAELAVEVDPQRLEQELVLALQRMDVDEELSRLESHGTELDQALRRDEAVGRRLDFLMQEFNREANTLSSKSQDAEMTRCAVEMKVLIEQMREQVQNIE
ncbi:MAG TPA: YicC/YloC family endoribonuclease [Nevskiaceae bacterium]|nr:YicC/YloC family endoribonuclease [Nevskiaceae bacterium]